MTKLLRIFVICAVFLIDAFAYNSNDLYVVGQDYSNEISYSDMMESIANHNVNNRSIIFNVIGFDSGYGITKFVFDIVPADADEDQVYDILKTIYELESITDKLNIDIYECLLYFSKLPGTNKKIKAINEYKNRLLLCK